ncbi:Clavaminate synthase-like protein [Suhomyces tanzawaensis NRRL Y-17324]|uniref:Clavaminate synthase-like protein n=1 Tax=Suhomyces tanzawaensis NRRL Y-17324 TaxID=984487 RepID=A0A1E4SKQ7_9ASCO|nr:Clavaminate synthase-like protein [Suhomyces tanzawaensis NRRL Y-17324]ODV80012.1 Clavaminate synthase-like protein [Suhomyces tanzawaensis NRRL Y-17324]
MIIPHELEAAGPAKSPSIESTHESKKRRIATAERYPDIPRLVSLFSRSIRHPLNVKPSGNAYLPVSNDTNALSRESQMGHFARFSDEMMMTFLSVITDESSLKNLSHTSRVMYAYLYDEDLWKKLYVRKLKDGQLESRWYGSWRGNVLKLDRAHQANLQLPDNLVCSDILYRPFQCSQIDYDKVFHKIIAEESIYHKDALNNSLKQLPRGRIQRISEKEMSPQDFNSSYHNTPFILVNNDEDRWPRWNFSTLLDRFPNVKFRQEAVEWDLSLYDEYLKNNRDESPLYLFDCSSVAMKTLRQEYEAPEIFKNDLFTIFNLENGQVNCRPDHAWLIVGPKRSGSTFHKDPNYTSAWNTALTGRKLWVMLPPDITPPGVGTDEEESEVTSPVGIAEWVMSGFFNDSLKIDECLIGVTFPGECMYVPSGWWHSVINLDDSVALTQNFVPSSKLPNALNFLKNKLAQISGFRPRNVKNVLEHVLDHLKEKGIEKSEITKLQEYRDKFETLNLGDRLANEDCGEIAELPPMPIFELFQVLLKLNGKQQELQEGLEKLKKIERKARELREGRSEAWEKLTKVEQEGDAPKAFSFGFSFDEESSDEE